MPRATAGTERLLKDVRRVLESPFWIPTLDTVHQYSRLQDDHDGKGIGRVQVTFTPNGDGYLATDGHRGPSLRFRMPLQGGGRSPRTRNALMILAEAIRPRQSGAS